MIHISIVFKEISLFAQFSQFLTIQNLIWEERENRRQSDRLHKMKLSFFCNFNLFFSLFFQNTHHTRWWYRIPNNVIVCLRRGWNVWNSKLYKRVMKERWRASNTEQTKIWKTHSINLNCFAFLAMSQLSKIVQEASSYVRSRLFGSQYTKIESE